MADQSTPDRYIPVNYDREGEPFWRSTLTPPDPSYGICMMVPDRVIPVIFVPGIMGTNLKSKTNGPTWNMDTATGLLHWAGAAPDVRKKYLRPEVVEVDPSGKISTATQVPESHLRERGWGEPGYYSYGQFLGKL